MPAKGDGTRSLVVHNDQSDGLGNGHDFEHIDVPSREEVAEEGALGHPGKPLNRRNPFFVGLTGGLGLLVAYVLFRAVSDIGTALELIGLAVFLAIGLDPAVAWLTARRFPRWAAVVVVVLLVLAFIGAFVAAAVGPISREIHELQVNEPKWRAEAENGKGWIGHLVTQFHLTSDLKSGSSPRRSTLPQSLAALSSEPAKSWSPRLVPCGDHLRCSRCTF